MGEAVVLLDGTVGLGRVVMVMVMTWLLASPTQGSANEGKTRLASSVSSVGVCGGEGLVSLGWIDEWHRGGDHFDYGQPTSETAASSR